MIMYGQLLIEGQKVEVRSGVENNQKYKVLHSHSNYCSGSEGFVDSFLALKCVMESLSSLF